MDRIPPMLVFYQPSESLFPLKIDDELLRSPLSTKPDREIHFRFDVAIYEHQVIEAKSILETLGQYSTLVDNIVIALSPLLKDTP